MIHHFGIDVLFSFRSEFKVPFYKDLIDRGPGISDTFIIMIDNSGSMKYERLKMCKSICTALIQHVANNNLEISVSFFNDDVYQLKRDNKDTFWNNDFYSLLEELMMKQATGGTNFNKALLKANEIIKNYQKIKNNQIRFLFLTDGQAKISEDTFDVLGPFKNVKSLIIYIEQKDKKKEEDRNLVPKVLKKLALILSGSLLRTDVSKVGILKVIRELLSD